MTKKRVTIKDIAKMANVSVGTVDRALNNRSRISTETSEMIIRIANEANYKPNKLASALGKKKAINIAAVFPEQPDYFFGEIKKGFEDAQNELSDFGLQIHYMSTENLNPETQLKTMKKISPSLFDGVLVATGGDGLEDSIDKLFAKGIPIATFNSDAVNSKRLFYIGVDYENSGRIAASLLGKFSAGKGKAAIFTGFKEVSSHKARRKGFIETLQKDYPAIVQVFGKDYLDRDELAYEFVKSYLDSHGDVTSVFTSSAPGTVGAGKAIAELEESKRPMLIGYDINRYSAKLLKNGICWGIIDQSPAMQSYYSTKIMMKYILEGSFAPEDIIKIRSQVILKENLNDYPEYADMP